MKLAEEEKNLRIQIAWFRILDLHVAKKFK